VCPRLTLSALKDQAAHKSSKVVRIGYGVCPHAVTKSKSSMARSIECALTLYCGLFFDFKVLTVFAIGAITII